MSEKEILLGYAKRGEPRSVWDVMTYYGWGDEEKGFEENQQEKQRWAMELKRLAMTGNIIAQQIIVEHSIDRAWEDFGLGESKEQITALQNSFRSNIFLQANAGNVEAIVSKAEILYCHQFPKDGEEESWLSMLMTAADGGSSRACENLYDYYERGGFTTYLASGNSDYWEACAQARMDREKALYYLQKGANCTDYYSYKCKKRMADAYMTAVYEKEDSVDNRKQALEDYKYWLRLAAQSGSLEALEEEKNIGQTISNVQYWNQELGTLNSHYISSKVITPTGKKGCYVATCVYGSYDCPEVWVLRRYRDNVLADTWYGRAFIRFYYWAGPKAVRWFGETAWFHRLFKKPIDNMVEKLKDRGFADTPYHD